ncbi:Rab3 GTPase-activating protein catalytic subunit [Mortierella antarctica]|nr:Rab3 GTPase-activating protein catalytic subunit [Mortierella antarctica]
MDDFESFEFIDYTTSGPWERFIIQIEDCLKKWGLTHNSYGVFDPSHSSPSSTTNSGSPSGQDSDNTHPSSTLSTPPSPPVRELYHRKEIVTLDEASYLLSYQYHPAKARILAGVQGIDLDFLPTTLESIQHHLLHRWTGLTHILVLTPLAAQTDAIVDLGSAKLLLSSFAIAFQNTGCNIPVFVPTGQPRSMTFTGLSIQPQVGVAKEEMGLEETEEDQAIEVRFNTVLVPYPPAQYTNLSGILDLFIERMGIEDEDEEDRGYGGYGGYGSGGGSGGGNGGGYSQKVKEQILVSGYFTYPLDNWYEDDWQKFTSLAAPKDGSDQSIHTLPFGPVQDPLKSLQLVARFVSAPSTIYLNTKNLTDMDASQANIWTISAGFKNDDYGVLSGILEDAIASWNMETSSTTSSNRAGREDGADKSSYGSLLRKGARLIQGTIAMVDVDDVNSIVEALFRPWPEDSIEYKGRTAVPRSRMESFKNNRLISAKELSLHFRHATVVPCNSFLWKMQQYLVDVISPDSDISYPTTFMGFMKAVWAEAIKEFVQRWERKELVPLVDIYEFDSQDLSEEGTEATSSRSRKRQPTIDLRFNLLHQKLSMLNCCIARENDLAAFSSPTSSRSQAGSVHADSDEGSAKSPLGSISSQRSPTSLSEEKPDHPKAVTEDKEVPDSSTTAPAPSEQGSPEQVAGSLDAMTISDSQSPEETKSPQLRSKPSVEDDYEAEGGLEQLKDLLLLETKAPLVIPRLQEHGYLTEDMIQDQEDMFENLGSSSDAAKIRMELQSVQLRSDMEAFKAANPGCVLGDFVRWHSPKDWDEEHGRMSTRMQDAGNFWQELWAKSKPIPAHRQKPLFDHRQEAEKVLTYLKKLSGNQLFVQLLPTAFLLAYDTLVSHPISPLINIVTESLKSLAQELTDFRWHELARVGSSQGSEGGATSLDLKPILSKFREVELLMGRALSLARKFPEQYSLIQRILQDTESEVEDGLERQCVHQLFVPKASIQSSFPKPNSREFVMETFDPSSLSFVAAADETGWHSRPLQRRMYACFRDAEVRIVEAVAKDGMFM